MSHPARDAWILAFAIFNEPLRIWSHPARDAWILATNMIQWSSISGVASRKGCVDFSNPLFTGRVGKILSHPARDAWILVLLAPIYFQTSKAAEDICCLDYILTSISPTLPFDIQPIQMIWLLHGCHRHMFDRIQTNEAAHITNRYKYSRRNKLLLVSLGLLSHFQ